MGFRFFCIFDAIYKMTYISQSVSGIKSTINCSYKKWEGRVVRRTMHHISKVAKHEKISLQCYIQHESTTNIELNIEF